MKVDEIEGYWVEGVFETLVDSNNETLHIVDIYSYYFHNMELEKSNLFGGKYVSYMIRFVFCGESAVKMEYDHASGFDYQTLVSYEELKAMEYLYDSAGSDLAIREVWNKKMKKFISYDLLRGEPGTIYDDEEENEKTECSSTT